MDLMRGVSVSQLLLLIDSGAGTFITQFHDRLDRVDFLRRDLTTFVHYLRPHSHTLIIGPGGGRDVLSALLFGDPRIQAVEVNGNIVHAVNGVFGNFSGHLDRQPGVHFTVDDGRNYLEKTREKFDVIQASLVDTAAATAAGAYTFTENGLYTQEAWLTFLRHLQPHGILTFSRWYFGMSTRPVEVYRTVTLAAAALRAYGVADPSTHLLVICPPVVLVRREGVAIILVSPDPFSRDDLAIVKKTCAALHGRVAYSSEESIDPLFAQIIADPNGDAVRHFPFDISAPVDDRPFFFFQSKPAQIFQNYHSVVRGAAAAFNTPAIPILITLLALSTSASLALLIIPYFLLRRKARAVPLSGLQACFRPLYFAALGLAYMFVEVGMLQRLSLYLGHPVYGFTISLTGLLIGSGMGSYTTNRFRHLSPSRSAWACFAPLCVVIVIVDAVSRELLANSIGHEPVVRALLALVCLLPLGLLMGCGFPLGMNQVREHGDGRGSWYWAVNGALSVTGSVAAMFVAFTLGLHRTLLGGMFLYALAGLLLVAGFSGAQKGPAAGH